MDTIAIDCTADDIAEALHCLNETAKVLRRKGYTGTASAEYARVHGRIDSLLGEWERA